ncbi:MAG: pyridine nucleotide-disulfide oxidoreductase [Xanthobacteraceae bacterium]|nr:MAG: pyridine nucleotide-disulfide oxidoreductase [Xanthobacteraceae bacterium]
MSSAAAPIIVVGAGQAGLQAAESLRADGYDGELLLIGEEPYLPYHRPPLSKQYLAGETDEERLVMRSAEALAEHRIELHRAARVTAIDRAARTVTLGDGRTLSYSGLVLATGSRPRLLPVPGADLDGVAYLRGLDDSRAILARLARAERVAVIGGGFIGLEIAATARKKFGKEVTVYEAVPRLMARAVAPPISDFFRALHEANGVRLRLDTTVAALEGEDGHVSAVVTGDGAREATDLVIVGIGIIPDDDLAKACGLACDAGIIVDACARTSDPRITAAGDCTARRIDGSDRFLRLESVQNAIEQGKSAAAALMGLERPFTAAPWFWSDQYDVKLQMAGLSAGYDGVVLRGAPEARAFSAFYFRAGRMIAVDSINRPADHVVARKILDSGAALSPGEAADPAFALKSVLQAGLPGQTRR